VRLGGSTIGVRQVKPGVVEFDTDAGKTYDLATAGG